MKLTKRLLFLIGLFVIFIGIAYERGLLNLQFVEELSPPVSSALAFFTAPTTVKVDAQGWPIDRRENNALSFETRLLHTALLGRPYGMDSDDLLAKNLPKNLSASGFGLAIAARQALRIEDGELFTSSKSLIDFLSGTTYPYEIEGLPTDFPHVMHADDLAMLHVYAMVMSGQMNEAVEMLTKFIDSKNNFTRAFCIMALRAIGSPPAREAIKSRVNTGEDSMLAQAALAFPLPNFSEPQVFAAEVMPVKRFRESMFAQAQLNTTKAILPTYLLAFVGSDAEPAQINKELEFLRGLYKTADEALWRKYMYGYNALAFRSQESFEQWSAMYTSDKDATRRSFILRAMSAQHPERFYAEMLPVFEKEANAWTQLEFLAIYRGLIKGQVLYGPFDSLWMPPVYYRLNFPYTEDSSKKRSQQGFVDLWASGRFPQDKNCSYCRQNWITWVMSPEDEPKFVRGYLSMPNRDAEAFSPLREIKQARLAPVVKYLAEREQDAAVHRAALDVYADVLKKTSAQAQFCCDATEQCLRQHVVMSPVPSDLTFKDDIAVAKYLDALSHESDVEIVFTDILRRRATAKLTTDSHVQTYEHWLGCWRKEGDESRRF